MSDINTPVHNADEQAAILLKAFDLAMQASNDRIYALKEVFHYLRSLAESYHTNEGKFSAVDENMLKTIITGLYRLEREQSPPPAPANEQANSLASWLCERATEASGEAAGKLLWASRLISGLIDEDAPEGAPVHRAPTPIPIPLEGVPKGACDENGFCWLGDQLPDRRWFWQFGQPNFADRYYLPHNTPSLPANTQPAP